MSSTFDLFNILCKQTALNQFLSGIKTVTLTVCEKTKLTVVLTVLILLRSSIAFHIEIMSLLISLHEKGFQLQSSRPDVCQSSAFALSNLAQGGDTICR